MADKTLAITLSYLGSDFHGFARQDGLATVQGSLEEALAILFRRAVDTVGAGRTDAGVHALGQVVSFEIDHDELEGRTLATLTDSLNALTPDSMVVRSVREKPAGFSARFSAIDREYRYRLVNRDVAPLFLAPYAWWIKEGHLNVNAMLEAASVLVGEHDFTSFCMAASSKDKNMVRELRTVHVFGMDHLGEPCIVVQVIGNAFVHSMVRIIVGTLVQVGLGRRDAGWVADVLAARDRRSAGQTAPAQGLTLWRVRYENLPDDPGSW